MRAVGSFEAKTHLSELLAAAEAGEHVTITRRGRPVARLGPATGSDPGWDRARAIARLADLRRRMAGQGGGLSTAEILAARDLGRR